MWSIRRCIWLKEALSIKKLKFYLKYFVICKKLCNPLLKSFSIPLSFSPPGLCFHFQNDFLVQFQIIVQPPAFYSTSSKINPPANELSLLI